MFDLKTMFDGWGTAILGAIIACIAGGTYFYTKLRVKQKQKAGDRSKQKQKINGDAIHIKQTQKAGNDSKQIQEG